MSCLAMIILTTSRKSMTLVEKVNYLVLKIQKYKILNADKKLPAVNRFNTTNNIILIPLSMFCKRIKSLVLFFQC